MSKPDRMLFLESSPYEADAGNLIGLDPRQVPLADIRLLEHPESPLKAIRAKCIDCSGGNAAEVRKCVAVNCALWPLRMGNNPFHASSASNKREAEATPISSGNGSRQTVAPTQNKNGPAEAATSPDHGSN